jgi:hypothetical protein
MLVTLLLQLQLYIITRKLVSQICVLMAAFVWLEEGIRMKEEWRSAAMECGGPFIVQGGIVVMLLSPVGSLESISHTLVCKYEIIVVGSLPCDQKLFL